MRETRSPDGTAVANGAQTAPSARRRSKQKVQRRIIKVELPFERAIGGTLTAPEQVNNMVEDGIKIHLLLPSTIA
jgi:hypothetical protein